MKVANCKLLQHTAGSAVDYHTHARRHKSPQRELTNMTTRLPVRSRGVRAAVWATALGVDIGTAATLVDVALVLKGEADCMGRIGWGVYIQKRPSKDSSYCSFVSRVTRVYLGGASRLVSS